MKKYINILVVAVLPLVLFSCKKDVLTGKGSIQSETRRPGNFSRIEMGGSNDVTIIKDTEYKVVITGYSSLLSAYETKVVGNKLVLGYEDNYIIRKDNLNIEVHTPYVDEIELNGSGDMYMSGDFESATFVGTLTGSGNMDINGGDFDDMYLTVEGSGNIDAAYSQARVATAVVKGSGNIHLHVIDRLKATIEGSGNIVYTGNPKLETEIRGSGDVRRR